MLYAYTEYEIDCDECGYVLETKPDLSLQDTIQEALRASWYLESTPGLRITKAQIQRMHQPDHVRCSLCPNCSKELRT
jgi:hypothetical protein